ncbi:MAG: Lrp/AsnC family transcriptional regulator [Bifidobacterium breve]
MSLSSVQSRIRKLERRGVLIGDRVQTIAQGWAAISAFVSVLPLTIPRRARFDRLRELEGVMSCYSVAGDPSYLLLVRVSSPEALEDLLGDIHRVVPVSTRSMVVLKTYYQDLF